MNKILTRSLLSCLAFLVVLLSSCDHKELCYEHPHKVSLRLVFDWRDAPDADPAGMHVCFYSLNGGKNYIFNFGRDGGVIESIEAGHYQVLCYNNTSSVLSADTHSFYTHGLFTRDGGILEPVLGPGGATVKDVADERVVICPDRMWGCTVTDVVIDGFGVSYVHGAVSGGLSGEFISSKEHLMTLFPHELTCTYTYEIRKVANLKHATRMCASLSGMAGSLLLCDESLGPEPVTLPFEAYSDGKSTITGRFYTFGHREDSPVPHRMALYVWMDDGRKVAYGLSGDTRFDVTGQIHSAPDRRRVHIVIEGIDLPTPIENGNGFNPDVDDWEVVEKDIVM